ncbi:heme transporter hrg1-b-like [Plakobranchus ocellatus]|uniref:Heme transporter hrg1-b-like n=1 Tax=Plakobranchus ocellatus TaxID=259542 RepID=A0AAV3ZEI1_9GAST|nr:heme transporter hrg1-b-like [Plakobranchus ocellatus]
MDETATHVRSVSSCGVKARLIMSGIGIFVGLSVFIVFTIQYKNLNVGIWALLSGIAAGVAFGVTLAYHKHVWDTKPRRLKTFMIMGCFTQLAGICGFVAYLVLAISQHQVLTAYGEGYYLTCVWCFMTWKWGFALLLYSRSFLRSYGNIDGILNKDSLNGKMYGK